MAKRGIIIVAGGSGSRMRSVVPKQFMELCGEPVLVHTLRRVVAALPDAKVVVALPESEMERWAEMARQFGLEDRHTVCKGGASRFESVRKALQAMGECELIGVHDGVRPLVSPHLIETVFEAALEHGAVVPVVATVDSFRVVTESGESKPFDRSVLRAVQTPQVFRGEVLRRAYAVEFDCRFTDDASVVEHSGHRVELCEGEYSNIKITQPSDIIIAEALLKAGV